MKYALLNVLFFVLLCAFGSPLAILLMGFNIWSALLTGVVSGFVSRMIVDRLMTGHWFNPLGTDEPSTPPDPESPPDRP